MATPARIAVLGAAGRMGRAIIRALVDTKGTVLVAALDRPKGESLGRDAGEVAGAGTLGIPVRDDFASAAPADVWIDFSVPDFTVVALETAAQRGVAMVVGTTGLGPSGKKALATAGAKIPIVCSANMSVGVNVLIRLVRDAAKSLGPEFDLELLEIHHRLKRDAPSGTAMRLAQELAETTSRDLSKVARYVRHGEIGARTDAEIGIQSIRGGDVIGDHTVFFLGQGERIEITHRASGRDTFARGAVRAALWVTGKAPGVYDMRDVLGLHGD